jgi:hypothetical protein
MMRSDRFIRGVMVCTLSLSLASLAAAAPPGAPNLQQRPQDGATITPNYKDADLSQIIQAVSEVTGKNFIIDPRVNAKVTMLSSTPMSPDAFYQAFLSVLQVYGYVAVPAGKVIKIVPNTDARQLPSIDLPNNVSATSDEMVTQIITMKNVSAAQLVPLLRPLIPQSGHLAAYPSGNMLIISDRASNVARIMKIIERMDESGDEPIEVIPLHNASATELVRTVNQLNQGAAGAGEAGAPVKVVADERTNSVLISGEKSLRLKVKALVLDLDTPRAGGAGDTEVRYLLYADAEKLADKLKGQASATAKAQAGPQAGATAPRPAAGRRRYPERRRERHHLGGRAHQCAHHDGAAQDHEEPDGGDRQARHSPRAGRSGGDDRRGGRQQERQPRRAVAARRRHELRLRRHQSARQQRHEHRGYRRRGSGRRLGARELGAPPPRPRHRHHGRHRSLRHLLAHSERRHVRRRHVQLEHPEGLCRAHSSIAQRRFEQHHLHAPHHHHEQRGSGGEGHAGDSAHHRSIHELAIPGERHHQPL